MDRQAILERFGIIGGSPEMRRVIDRVRQIARTDIAVLVEGESGVGKELVANLLHEIGARRHKSLVVVNCGAIPEGLIEAELFGAEKGSYTGSVERRIGYFEEADGGTIFLDEIGELPLQAQVRLLRVLESGSFNRVGSSVQMHSDARVVAATNKDLAVEVSEGRFREDLYYRLSTVVIRIPPLRERQEDILPLFEHFLYRASQRYDAPMRRLDESARQLLLRYNWPGNVREVRNVAEQAAVLLREDPATADEIRPFLRGVSAAMGLARSERPSDFGDLAGSRERELIYKALLELRFEIREMKELLRRGGENQASSPQSPDIRREQYSLLPEPQSATDYGDVIEDVPFEIESDDFDEPDGTASNGDAATDGEPSGGLMIGSGPLPTMEAVEKALIVEALRRFEGNRRQTARALGMSERTLYRKLKELEEEGLEI